MNNYIGQGRKRNQTLLVVEGNHEKNKLFWLIFRCFPEISIDMDNVWIYGTNIYMLYDDIIREYGENCFEEEMDIDLPFVISKKRHRRPFGIRMILQIFFLCLIIRGTIQIFLKREYWNFKTVLWT